MEDLRWILLLVGALVIAAVYFSSRFEREDWVREREQFDARNKPAKKPTPKSVRRQPMIREEPLAVTKEPSLAVQKIRKEPQMTSSGAEIQSAKDIDSTIDPITQDNDRDDAVIDLAAVPKAVEDFPKKSEMESALNSSSATVSSSQDAPSAPTEEKTVSEQDKTDEQKTTTTTSVSEIPTDVELTEETVSELLDVTEEGDKQKHHLDDEIDIPGLSVSSNIEDEITGVEIPADLAIAEAALHSESQQDSTKESSSAKIDLPPNVEPLVLVLTIMSEDEPFAGPAVHEALEAEGLRHGDMRIFHCFTPDETPDAALDKVKNNEKNNKTDYPIFSVASLVEPGYFELDKIDEMEMPGLTLFCQLPGPLSGEEAFNVMLDKARGIAVRLHGQLCDDKRNRFTTQAKTHYQDRISTFVRELAVARKKIDA